MATKKVRYIGRHKQVYILHEVHGRMVFERDKPRDVESELAENMARQVDKFEIVKGTPAKKKSATAASTDPEEG